MADEGTESSETESSGGSDDENYGKSLQMFGSKVSSWTYIVRSIKNCLTNGQQVESSTIFFAAQQALVCDDIINAIRLFGLAFDQCKSENIGRQTSSTNKPADRLSPGRNLQPSFKFQLYELRTIIGAAFCRFGSQPPCTQNNNKQLEIDDEQRDLSQSINNILSCYKYFDLEDAMLLSQASAFYLSIGDYDSALDLSNQALSLDPLSIFVQEVHENLCCHLVERWHFAMLNDTRRNRCYEKAMIRVIDQFKDSVSVCDVGCGTGLLSLMAGNQLNCKSVYAIEKMDTMSGIAKKVFAENLTEENARKIKLINKSSSQMTIPTDISHRAQILVTEIFDAGLFGEGILPTLCHAWSNLLNQEVEEMGSIVIPSSAKLYVVAIESAAVLTESRVTSDAHFCTLDHSNICMCSTVGMCSSDPYTTHDLKRMPGGYRELTEPWPFMEVDFNNPQELLQLEKGVTKNFSLTVTKSGRLDALAMWFSLCLLDTEQISTHTDSHGCWEQAIFPVNPVKIKYKLSLKVQSGDKLQVTQVVKGAQHLLTVTEILSPGSNDKDKPNYDEIGKDTVCSPLMLAESPVEWCRSQTFCLDGSEIVALNNTQLSQALCHQLDRLLPRGTSYLQPHLVHLNNEFSPLCLHALQLGYSHAWAIANKATHKVLLWKLAEENHIDISHLTLLEDVSQFCLDNKTESQNQGNAYPNETSSADTCEASHSTDLEKDTSTNSQTGQNQMNVVVLDIVDWQGRLLEDLDEKILTIRNSLPANSEISVLPHWVDVCGVLIESEELLSRSRVVSDERTLGYKIATFVNKFSTRNHQGIELQSLPHTMLCKPFRIFSVDLRKVLVNASHTVPEKDDGGSAEKHPTENQHEIHNQKNDGFEQKANIKVRITASGTVTALVYWFHLHLQDGKSISSLNVKTDASVSDGSIHDKYHNSITPKTINCLSNSGEHMGLTPSAACSSSAVPNVQSTADVSSNSAFTQESNTISSTSHDTVSLLNQTKFSSKAASERVDNLSNETLSSSGTSNTIISTLDPTHHWQQAAVMADPAKEEKIVVAGNDLNLQCVMGSSALSFRIED